MSFIKFNFDKEVNSLYANFNGTKHYVKDMKFSEDIKEDK